MRARILITALTFGVFGCAGGVYSAQVTATTPELVYIDPDIQVVVDSEYPVFYTDSFYWRYYNDVWYRSPYATRGWVRIDVLPPHLRRIERPRQYARYRPHDRGPVVRDHRTQPPVVREQRTPPPPVERDHRAPPPPAVRDQRTPPPPAVQDQRRPPPAVRDHRKDEDNDKDKDRRRDPRRG